MPRYIPMNSERYNTYMIVLIYIKVMRSVFIIILRSQGTVLFCL